MPTALAYLPVTQKLHVTLPAVGWNQPFGQERHDSSPSSCWPGLHGQHTGLPSLGMTYPAGQLEQLGYVVPVIENVPASQATLIVIVSSSASGHALPPGQEAQLALVPSPAAIHRPALHALHAVFPSASYVPAAHALHALLPCDSCIQPLGQDLHETCPLASWNWPAEQALQSDPP